MGFLASTQKRTDTKRIRWAKILVAAQAITGANTTYALKHGDTIQRCLVKIARTLGATVNDSDVERRLLFKILTRLNILAGTRRASPPAPQFGFGVTITRDEPPWIAEEKLLAEMRRAQSFSTSSPPAVNGTAPTNDMNPLQITRLIVKRLNQTIA